MNYLDIKDLKSLDAARSELSSELVRKKAELKGRYLNAKACFSPVALLASSVKSAALHFLPMDSLVVGMMRYFFRKKKEKIMEPGVRCRYGSSSCGSIVSSKT